jgi:serine/threonine protein kinase
MGDTAYSGAVDSLVGTQLAGRYELVELLGTGGMGAVYKAKQLKFDSFVAVKLMRPALELDQTALQRLRQEAQVLAALEHPCIPKVHCIELLDAGTLFLAMDFIEGKSLQQELATRKRLPTGEAFEIFVQLADALAHAHNKGIVHRDIKPANVILSGMPGNRRAYVLDFGIAKRLEGSQKFTQTGAIVGTVQYMSPEQASGGTVDHRSDIYSLGCVLYETLSGRALFDGESPMVVMMKHVQETVPSFKTAEVGDYASLLTKALAKNPDDRFQSMEEFGDALRKPRSVHVSAAKGRTKKVPVPFIILGTGCIAAAGIIAFQFYQNSNRHEPPVSQTDAVAVTGRPSSVLLTLDKASKGLDVDHVSLHFALNAIEDPNKHYPDHARAIGLDHAASVWMSRGNINKATEALKLALKYQEMAKMPLLSAGGLADFYLRDGRIDKAFDLMEGAMKHDEKAGVAGEQFSLMNRLKLAQMYERQFDFKGAAREYDLLAHYGSDLRNMKFNGILSKADMLGRIGSHAQAAKIAHDWMKTYGEDSEAPIFMGWALNLVADYEFPHDMKKRSELFSKSLRISADALNSVDLKDRPAAIHILVQAKSTAEGGLSVCYASSGDMKKALPLMEAAMSTCENGHDMERANQYRVLLQNMRKREAASTNNGT